MMGDCRIPETAEENRGDDSECLWVIDHIYMQQRECGPAPAGSLRETSDIEPLSTLSFHGEGLVASDVNMDSPSCEDQALRAGEEPFSDPERLSSSESAEPDNPDLTPEEITEIFRNDLPSDQVSRLSLGSGDSGSESDESSGISPLTNHADPTTVSEKYCYWMPVGKQWEASVPCTRPHSPVKVSKLVLQSMRKMRKAWCSLRDIKKYLSANCDVDVPALDAEIKDYIAFAVREKIIEKSNGMYKIPYAAERRKIAREKAGLIRVPCSTSTSRRPQRRRRPRFEYRTRKRKSRPKKS